jgi:hypothetical protein
VYDSTANIRTASVARGTEFFGTDLLPRVYTTGASGAFNPVAIGVAPASAVWGTYAIDLNYLTRTFSVSLNSVTLASNVPMHALADNGIDINFTVNGRGIDVAYFDNFLVSAVPEPATISAIAMLALLTRRRRCL